MLVPKDGFAQPVGMGDAQASGDRQQIRRRRIVEFMREARGHCAKRDEFFRRCENPSSPRAITTFWLPYVLLTRISPATIT